MGWMLFHRLLFSVTSPVQGIVRGPINWVFISDDATVDCIKGLAGVEVWEGSEMDL